MLGTGSRHAARVYIKEGFNHLLGGLSEATKGYNPEDEGEWMMVRRVDQGNIAPFLPDDFYDQTSYLSQSPQTKFVEKNLSCGEILDFYTFYM